MNTGPVDVLAVMEGAADTIDSEFSTGPHSNPSRELREARAAVAELIRVSQAVLDDMNSVAPKYRAQQSVDELTAALDNVRPPA